MAVLTPGVGKSPAVQFNSNAFRQVPRTILILACLGLLTPAFRAIQFLFKRLPIHGQLAQLLLALLLH
jgi:hypothetical protein